MHIFDAFVEKIGAVLSTFSQKDFPSQTRQKLVELISFIENASEGYRGAVETGSPEDDAGIEFANGLAENCLEAKEFQEEQRNFTEARKIFQNEIFFFWQALAGIENKPYAKWKSFKILQSWAPVYQK